MDEKIGLGARIREFRERLGIQGQELALRVELDPSAISNIERGKRGVKSDELAAIAKALGVSALALLEEDSLLGRLPVAPRASSGTLVKGDVLARLTGLAELHEVLAEFGIPARYLDLSPIDTSRWLATAPEAAALMMHKLDIEATGEDRFLALVRSIENTLGIDVLVEQRETEGVLGASVTDPEFSLIFVNGNQQIARALFTLAHELGHVIARDGRSLILDDDLIARSDSERFANAFAAAMLLPEDEVRKEIPRDDVPDAMTLCRLLDHWGTSFETLVYRLHNLRIINAAGRDRFRSLGLRGLVAQIDDENLASRLMARVGLTPARHVPSLLAARASSGYRQGVISARPLAGLYGVDPDIVSATMELDAAASLEEAVGSEGLDNCADADLYDGSPVD